MAQGFITHLISFTEGIHPNFSFSSPLPPAVTPKITSSASLLFIFRQPKHKYVNIKLLRKKKIFSV